MSIKRLLAAATVVGTVATLVAPNLSSAAHASISPLSRMGTVDAVNREPVGMAKGGGGGGGGGGGHKPGSGGGTGGSNNVAYGGGVGGVGVETSPKVYVVFWGWTSDPYAV